ncbi:Rossmann-like and DUF2520 domain-containing protein [Vitiosangium sp. GDMCC 1.1324]|uniref:Rossmann-like and DUF2520 domain-containing protein n=1 Tax=Vitiosangium sp. (strain GDMCC 1.1324) TaxID=2138576 RepID=UPI000D350674|nr:Rossmann-like and DUF2520 domain-containing protein [Vitiosangium sp. GDMCC 1.1324]PTL85311.1 DUF2520 domain-containing protein [Vitiosangium sp. GDMCC 1.1324]
MSPSRPSRPRVVVVGTGRLGGALALALAAKRWHVRVLARSEEGRRRALELGLKPATDADVAQARVCLLCVPDKSVSPVAEELKPRLARGAALVHCAGALSLEALGPPRGRVLGSFHPLVAVSDPRDSLAGNSVAISTRSRWLRDALERMAKDVGLRALRVPEKKRAAYHAGAVLSAGGVVAALSAAVEAFRAAGISEEDALAALLPLTRSALRGVEARGLSAGYTGPIARGDSGVVAAHLAALPPESVAVYQPLSRRGLELVGHRLPPEARAALEALLD